MNVLLSFLLFFAAPVKPEEIPVQGSDGIYTVLKAVKINDTLTKILTRHKITQEQLLAVNPEIDFKKLKVNQMFRLPVEAPPPPVARSDEQKKWDEIVAYLHENPEDKELCIKIKETIEKIKKDIIIEDCVMLSSSELYYLREPRIRNSDLPEISLALNFCYKTLTNGDQGIQSQKALDLELSGYASDFYQFSRSDRPPIRGMEGFFRGEGDLIPVWKRPFDPAVLKDDKALLAFYRVELSPGHLIYLSGTGRMVIVKTKLTKTLDVLKALQEKNLDLSQEVKSQAKPEPPPLRRFVVPQ
ncbi:MAG: hypothetical protein RL095_3016 [Verrucomicrobiota bacterium]|jgi:hypothetical protein